jgi:hypothetical protein
MFRVPAHYSSQPVRRHRSLDRHLGNAATVSSQGSETTSQTCSIHLYEGVPLHVTAQCAACLCDLHWFTKNGSRRCGLKAFIPQRTAWMRAACGQAEEEAMHEAATHVTGCEALPALVEFGDLGGRCAGRL